ncbi:MAG: hypothetical protein M3N13_02900 [Candidatus Eremiobacteraeota bacterium]|nr:hypothetical protein [Candidatus Eremiobacteraeota bacterium]
MKRTSKPAARKQRRALNKKPAFLAAFKACADLTASAKAVGINRGQHYEWLAKDATYAAAYEAAKVEATQTLHDAAVARALTGVFVPNVYQGRFCYPQENYEISPAIPAGDWKDENPRPAVPAVFGERDVPGSAPLGTWTRSEALHLALLRAHIPAFRANAVEITGAGGGPIASTLTIEFVRPKSE